MKTIKRAETYNARPERVFQCLDNLGITGMHMTKPSMAMMGSKLVLNFLTENKNGLGSKYRWTGTMMWMNMDFTVIVTKWVEAKEKTWETVGLSKMIIYSWYRMHFDLKSLNDSTVAELSITYERPTGLIAKFISWLFADLYCNWCLKSMLGDTKKTIESS